VVVLRRWCALLLVLAGSPTAITAPVAVGEPPPVRFGIKLLDAPVSREDDPRAHAYIIDHLPPGATIQRHIQVVNQTASRLVLELYPGMASIQDGQFAFAPAGTPGDLTRWITLDPASVDLAPYGSATALTTIHVPPDATAAERYGVIWAEHRSPPGPQGNVGLNSRVGIRVYLDIGPGGEPASDFHIDQLVPARTPDGRPQLRAQVHNTGGRAVDITGTLSLASGPDGLAAGPFPVDHGRTLAPGDTATTTITLGTSLPAGPWQASLILRSGLIEHTATATITFPAARLGAPVTMTSPWPARLLAAGLILATGTLALALRRRLKPRN
jgi:hypothetical protein